MAINITCDNRMNFVTCCLLGFSEPPIARVPGMRAGQFFFVGWRTRRQEDGVVRWRRRMSARRTATSDGFRLFLIIGRGPQVAFWQGRLTTRLVVCFPTRHDFLPTLRSTHSPLVTMATSPRTKIYGKTRFVWRLSLVTYTIAPANTWILVTTVDHSWSSSGEVRLAYPRTFISFISS